MTAPTQERGLVEIGEDAGSDKLTHGYLPFYEDIFEPLRDHPIRLLEIGVGGFQHPDDPTYGGHSLRMWRDYFPSGHVVGLDILDKSGVADDRISIVQGSQIDASLLRRISETFGPFDIIIDDGSHIPAHARFSFNVLFPMLTTGGIYVIEDTQTSYWPLWGGRFRRNSKRGSMALVKERLDGLNHAEFKLPRYTPTTFDRSVTEIRARHNTVAFLKGDNSQPSSLNHPHPIAYRSWLQDDVVPAVVMRLRNPALLDALDRIGLRRVAGAARRRLVPGPDDQPPLPSAPGTEVGRW